MIHQQTCLCMTASSSAAVPLHDALHIRFSFLLKVVHVCAEHKKPQKLLKHLASIKEQSAGMRNPPR